MVANLLANASEVLTTVSSIFFHLLQINEKQCLLTCCQEFQRIDEQYTIRLETSIGKA